MKSKTRRNKRKKCRHENTKYLGDPFVPMRWTYNDNNELSIDSCAYAHDFVVSALYCNDCKREYWVACGRMPHGHKRSRLHYSAIKSINFISNLMKEVKP